jgi:polyisoprenoid-binding protein YceI
MARSKNLRRVGLRSSSKIHTGNPWPAVFWIEMRLPNVVIPNLRISAFASVEEREPSGDFIRTPTRLSEETVLSNRASCCSFPSFESATIGYMNWRVCYPVSSFFLQQLKEVVPVFKSMFYTLGLTLCLAAPSFAEDLKVNKEKSKINFVGKKTDGKHVGGFKDMTAEAKVDHESPAKSSLKIEIKTDSLWSDDEMLTAHLKNPDFFDVKKYPTIKFESTKIDMSGAEGTITGKLTMLGKTEEVKVPVKAEISDSELKLVAEFKIDRMKWGMTSGKGKIDDEVAITAELLFPRS